MALDLGAVQFNGLDLGAFDTPQTAFTYSRTITIDHTKIPTADLTDFTVLISGTYPYLATTGNGGNVQNANGYDIAFYSDAGLTVQLSHEIGRYVAATGQVLYWVKIPTVATATDTVFYMAYGNASISSSMAHPTSAWDSNHLLVYHFGDGSTLGLNDSTANVKTLTNTNTATAVTGQVYGGVGVSSASSQKLNHESAYVQPIALTVSFWAKATSFPQSYNTPYHSAATGSVLSDVHVKSNGKLAAYFANSAGTFINYDGTGIATLSTGTWYHIAVTYSAAAGLTGYVQGVLDRNTSGAGLDLKSGATPVLIDIGNDRANSPRFWNGSLDEYRVSNVARTAGWVAAEYNNQNSPSTFYTIGTDAFTGTAAAAVSVTAAAAGSQVFIGTGAAAVSTASSASGSLVFSGTAAASASATASATGAQAFTGTASAVTSAAASAVGSLVFTGTASAAASVSASASGSTTDATTGTADAAVSVTAQATGLLVFSGTATAEVTAAVDATGALVFIGSAGAIITASAAATGIVGTVQAGVPGNVTLGILQRGSVTATETLVGSATASEQLWGTATTSEIQ